MPPAPLTLVRSNARTVDIIERREVLKPYKEPIISSSIRAKNGEKKEEMTNFKEEFMDIDEFFQHAASSKDSSQDEDDYQMEDMDYPKPQVDLLASLLTLGKMIQDQKQLIKQQSRQRQLQINIPENMVSDQSVLSIVVKKPTVIPVKWKCSGKRPEIECLDNENPPNIKAPSEHEQGMIEPPTHLPCDRPSSPSSSNEGSPTHSVIPYSVKDNDYWDRRRRNNLAAKKSREERRKKELEVIEAAKQLSKENSQLTAMLKRLTARNELLESRLQDIRRHQRGQVSTSTPGIRSSDN